MQHFFIIVGIEYWCFDNKYMYTIPTGLVRER